MAFIVSESLSTYLPGIQLTDSMILLGDACHVLSRLPRESIQSVVTSPPYWGLRDYDVEGQIGLESTLPQFINRLIAVFQEVKRILKPDGTFWLNIGDGYTSGNRGWRAPDKKNPARAMSVRPDTPEGLKPKDLIGIPWRLALALQEDGWYLRSDIIWCLSGGTWVYARTQKGDMPIMIRDLYRLRPDTVKLWNGQVWTKLRGMSKAARKGDELELVLRSGERISCTPTHKFPTKRGLLSAGKLQVGDCLQLARLPEPELYADSPYIGLDAAWFVGLYIAEGSRSLDTIQVAGHAKEEYRWNKLENIAQKYGGSATRTTDGNKMDIRLYGKILNALIDQFVSGKTAHTKCLASPCWRYSDAWLNALLDGYLSGDGHYDAKNNRWRLGFTRNYNLERDLRTICARLGYKLKITLSYSTCNGKKYPSFRGELRQTITDHHNTKDMAEIVAIKKARCREVYDLGVESTPYTANDHLFTLTSGILTHNSKPNAMPESVKDRPTRTHEYIFLFTRSERYYYDHEAIKEPSDNGKGKRNRRSVWDVNTEPCKDAHFATFPPKLIEPCILAGSRSGDYVLDPFFGAGTVGLVCQKTRRKYIGIELHPEYVELAANRLSKHEQQLRLNLESSDGKPLA